MLDPKLVRNEPELFSQALEKRGLDPELLTKLQALDQERRDLIQRADELKQQRNTVSKELGRRKKAGEDITEQAAQMRDVGAEIKAIDSRRGEAETEFTEILERIPNLPDSSVPAGVDDQDNEFLRDWGEPKTFSFEAKPHWDIGEELGILDFKASSKISGSRFWVLKGAGARLERALITFMLDLHTGEHGYQEVLAPSLVTSDTLYGTGQLPKFEEDLFRCEGKDLYLIPTSEVSITSIHRDEILEADRLPLHYCGFSPCYRAEAGAAGKDTRGLVRVHQFHKVELIKLVHPETSFEELEKMVQNAQRVLELLEIPHRVMALCLGDLGFSAAKTYDIEFWSPPQNRWIEISSCSNCTDFQARRAAIRFKSPGQSTEFVHTLNGSGLAVGRTMVAIMENYQNEDGSLTVPEVLRPYMGGLTKIERGQLAPTG